MFWCSYPRDFVQVNGPDAITFLHSQLSQDIQGLDVGDSRWSFVLQPTGKVEVLARVYRSGVESFVLDTDATFGDALITRLNRFKIRVKAEIVSVPWKCIALRGTDVESANPGEMTGEGGAALASWGGGVDLIGPQPKPPAAASVGSADDLLAARIAATWPAMGSEIVAGKSIPGESAVVSVAVNFTKGCYPGQELVERMDSRGASAPRLLSTVAVLAGTAVGDPYVVAGETVGVVTSVLGQSALVLIKRSRAASPE